MTSIGVFAGVTNQAGKVLCVRHGYGARDWGMPGGRLEVGEDPIACVKREVLEETGCRIETRHLVGIYSAAYRDDIVILFAADLIEEGDWSPSDEIAEVAWFDLDDLPEPMAPNPRLRFGDIRAGVAGVVRVLSQPGEISLSG